MHQRNVRLRTSSAATGSVRGWFCGCGSAFAQPDQGVVLEPGLAALQGVERRLVATARLPAVGLLFGQLALAQQAGRNVRVGLDGLDDERRLRLATSSAKSSASAAAAARPASCVSASGSSRTPRSRRVTGSTKAITLSDFQHLLGGATEAASAPAACPAAWQTRYRRE